MCTTATFLLLTVSCLLSVAQGRELLGSKIYDSIHALNDMQEASNKIIELEAKYESLMQASIDQQQAFVDQQQAFADLQQVVSNQQDIINELQHGQRLRSASINGDVIDRDTVRTIAETVFAEQAPKTYDALVEQSNTDAWQNATLANLTFSDAWQNDTISSMKASISSLQTNVASISKKEDADIWSLTYRVETLEENSNLFQTAIYNNHKDIENNTAAITNLTEEFSAVESWNVTSAEELTEKVDANTASISSLNSTVDSDASRITHLEGMELLEDHYYVSDTVSFDSGDTTLGSFTVSAGNVLDFKAAYQCRSNFFTYINLYKDGSIVAQALCTVDNAGNMDIIYRDQVSSDSTFEFKFYGDDSGYFVSPYNFWGYKVYAGSSYNFIEG